MRFINDKSFRIYQLRIIQFLNGEIISFLLRSWTLYYQIHFLCCEEVKERKKKVELKLKGKKEAREEVEFWCVNGSVKLTCYQTSYNYNTSLNQQNSPSSIFIFFFHTLPFSTSLLSLCCSILTLLICLCCFSEQPISLSFHLIPLKPHFQ